MPRVRLSAGAKEDLVYIWEYIARDNAHAADTMLARIMRTVRVLASLPGVGRERNELKRGLRGFPEGPFVIFYTRLPRGGIQVVRIIHGNRDIAAQF